MKKLIGLALMAGVLASCSFFQTKVPITGDAASLGLRGKPVTVSLLKNDLRLQSSATISQTYASFADPSNLSQYVNNIKDWVSNVGFDGTAVVTPGAGAATTCPSTLTLSGITLNISLTSGSTTRSFALIPSASTLTMTEGSDCNYTFNASALVFGITISGDDLKSLMTMLTDSASNTPSVSGSVTANELTGQYGLALTWGDATATITVGL